MTTTRMRFGGAVCAALMIAATWTLSGQTQAGQPVTYQRLLNADQEPGNWLMYSGGYNGWRFSRLNQINAQNAKNLRVKWLFQGRHNEKFETTPLVVDGIMYLTRPENAIYALDALTGRQLWMYEHRNPERTFNCCGRVNRGLAILGTTLFMNTLDMHVIAVDAKSGRELWKTKMFDHLAAGGYAAPGAPLYTIDNEAAGRIAGEALGQFANRAWRGQSTVAAIVGPVEAKADRAPERVQGVVAGLRARLPAVKPVTLDTQGNPARVAALLGKFIAAHPGAKILVATTDDSTALAAKSKTRFTTVRKTPWRKPSPSTIQLALSDSRITCWYSRSVPLAVEVVH